MRSGTTATLRRTRRARHNNDTAELPVPVVSDELVDRVRPAHIAEAGTLDSRYARCVDLRHSAH